MEQNRSNGEFLTSRSSRSTSSISRSSVAGATPPSTTAPASTKSRESSSGGQYTEAGIRAMVHALKSRNSNNGGGRQPKGGPWMTEEDDALRLIFSGGGDGTWGVKASKLNEMMAAHYNKLTSTAVANGKQPKSYGRDPQQCLHRWKKVLQPGLKKERWTEADDNIVRGAVTSAEEVGTVRWREVADKVPGRLPKQCRERWFNHLDPSVTKKAWTSSEDDILFNAQMFFDSRWCEIARLLPGRPANTVKNRYNSCARKKWQQANAGGAANGLPSKRFLRKLKASLNGSAVCPTSKKRALEQAPASTGGAAVSRKPTTKRVTEKQGRKKLKKPQRSTKTTASTLTTCDSTSDGNIAQSPKHAQDDYNSKFADITVGEQGHHGTNSVLKTVGGTSLTSEKSPTPLKCARDAEVGSSGCYGIATGGNKARGRGFTTTSVWEVLDSAMKVKNRIGSRGDDDNRTIEGASGTEETGSSSSSLNSFAPASPSNPRGDGESTKNDTGSWTTNNNAYASDLNIPRLSRQGRHLQWLQYRSAGHRYM